MLEHVGDPELNDVARVGPLRRKMLKDALAFYQRIPPQPNNPANARFRMVQTWERIGGLSWQLNEVEQARQAFKTSIALLEKLVAEYSRDVRYRAKLANGYTASNYLYGDNYAEREKFHRQSLALFAELAVDEPHEENLLIRQAEVLNSLANILRRRGKRAEARDSLIRALELLDRAQVGPALNRAETLFELAWICPNGEESDVYFHQAIAIYYDLPAKEKTLGIRQQFAGMLYTIACQLQSRHPEEAEKLWDESVVLWHEICGPTATHRDPQYYLIRSLLDQARHQRRLAATLQITETSEQLAHRLIRGESLYQEAISRQREMVSKFVLQEDRFALATILQEQAEHYLGPAAAAAIGEPEVVANKLSADALLTEAIQLCRALTAEFEGNADYKSRLSELLKLQAQHFGQKNSTEQKQ